jgi:2-polyprenyl-6-methoxyphenol hydroxylase-like FAD-dependent oxidoreductase/acetyl esterase/lipase
MTRTLIAGGGTAGLATAIGLRAGGVDALVLEQAPAFTAIGAGLGLHVNAMRALTYLRADGYWRSTAARIDIGEQRGLDDGRLISTTDYAQLARRYGEHYYCGHRADLLQSLLGALPDEAVRASSRVVGFEETPGDVRVALEDGGELTGDLLIGADGLRSRVRQALFGEAPAEFTGVVVWRGLMPAALVPAHYQTKIIVWYGARRHVIFYPLRHPAHPESVYMFSGFVPVAEVQRESWSASGDVEDLRASLDGACDDVQELLDLMGPTLITGIHFRAPLQEWGTRRVVLAGDAAHPAPPSAGQGAGMALEDGVMLAACVHRAGEGHEAEAVAEYVHRRQARTERMLESSRVNLLMSQVGDPVLVRARDGYERGLRRINPLGPPMAEWLLSHDPVAAARQAADDFALAGTEPRCRLRRPEARAAFELWRTLWTVDHRSQGWLGQRAGWAAFQERELAPGPAVRSESVRYGDVPALRVRSGRAPGPGAPIVFHIHGGGYAMGSAQGSVRLVARQAEAIGGWGVTVDYRLAPEHPFPAALDDLVAAYVALTREHPATPVFITGECAGGGLAMALALSLRDAGQPLPDGIHVVSPFCDLAVSEAALGPNSYGDPWADLVTLTQLAAGYVQDRDPRDPLISSVYARLSELPPVLVHAARGEALFDMAVTLARKIESAGGSVAFEPVDDTVHSFVLFDFLPEAGDAIRRFGAFAGEIAGLTAPR